MPDDRLTTGYNSPMALTQRDTQQHSIDWDRLLSQLV
jgi:hypothetical protein